jgi:competence protein ComEA
VPEGARRIDDAPGPPAVRGPTSTPIPPPTVGALTHAWLTDRAPLWAQEAVTRLSLGAVVATIAVVLAVVMIGRTILDRRDGGGYPSYSSSSNDSASDPAPYPSTAATTSVADGESIVVDVGGRVRKPGLVTLPAGARVADAIDAAGGPLHQREIATMDLAARVTDGQLLLVGTSPSAPPSAAPGSPSAASPVDLDTATLEELETLPGVGPVTGQKIIDWRTAHSGFTSIQQLQQVSGIGPATYADLAPLVAP